MNRSRITIVIVIILVLVAAYWAYNQYFGSSAAPVAAGVTVTSSTGTIVPVDNSTASQLVRVLSDVDKTTLQNRSIFSNSIFKDQLKDFGKVVAERPIGRTNPFAPIGGSVTVATQPAGAAAGAAAGAGANQGTPAATNNGGNEGGDSRLDILGQ